jgi:chromosome partitioning protein
MPGNGGPVVFALANQKGGVGKTTTAINLGAEMATRGVPVLIVDLDPQANSTAGLGLSGQTTTVYDVLINQQPMAGAVIDTVQERLKIVPSGPDLAGAEVELVPAMAREQRLLRAIDRLGGDFAAILVDSPPSLGLLTLNALTAADEVLVPVQCEYLALEGLSQLMTTLEAVRNNLNHHLHLGGLLLTMYDARTNLCQQVADEVRGHYDETFQTVIPRSVRLSEAPSYGLPIGQYDGRSSAAKAYGALADEVIEKFLPSFASRAEAKP